MEMKFAFLASILILFFFVASESVPVLVWSGKHDHFQGNFVHKRECSSQQVSSIFDKIEQTNEKVPKVILAFLHNSLRSDEFLIHANAFGKIENGGSFTHLMKYVKDHSSIIFPECEISSDKTFVSDYMNNIVSKFPTTHVKGISEINQFISSLKEKRFEMRPDKINVIVVLFDDIHEGHDQAKVLSENDAMMNEIINAIGTLTNDNYVALFAANTASTPDIIGLPNTGRDVLGILQQEQNETYWVNEPLYINSEIVGGILSFLIFLLLLVIALKCVHAIETPPHIVDAFPNDVDSKKKND
jgi:hypothetical protein